MCRNQHNILPTFHFRTLIHFSRKIQFILDDPAEVIDEAEAQLAVITASERTTWANLRDKSFLRGINKKSLDIIESAAFVVVLDDYEYDYDEVIFLCISSKCTNKNSFLDLSSLPQYDYYVFVLSFKNDATKGNEYGKYMLHGKGYDRWFDKSLCAIVGSNGRIGFNVEHSWYK